MDISFEDLKSTTDEALMISMIKLLVFKDLKERLEANENKQRIIKDRINEQSNDFFKPTEQDFRTQDYFNSFIKKLSEKILNEFQ